MTIDPKVLREAASRLYQLADDPAALHPHAARATGGLLHMAADHAAGRGPVCSSCVDQAHQLAEAVLAEVQP